MTIVQREQQILRIKAASFQSELDEQLEQQLRSEVVRTVQTILEAALIEELEADLQAMPEPESKPRRSGYFKRRLDSQYGRIDELAVPKLRHHNKLRRWRILERYQRSLKGFLDFAGYLYVMGLSLRDLQEALYFLLGKILSHNAVNRVTLRMQAHMEHQRQAVIEHTPAILIVDGVWVEIQYPTGLFKQDRAGHMRQSREAEERVILSVMAVWPDGSYELLHYQIASGEDETAWLALFDAMIARGLDPQTVQLVVSDGAKGLLAAMAQRLPQARQQRCITHKVRGMEPYLSYQQLPEQTDDGQPLAQQAAKEQRRFEIKRDAYDRRKSRRDDIYHAPSYEEAQGRLEAFVAKWQALEAKAVHAFTWGIKRTFTFYDFDAALYPHIRTTNHLERFFREFRAKADEIGAFPNELSCLTLFFVVMQREHAKHDRLAVAKTS